MTIVVSAAGLCNGHTPAMRFNLVDIRPGVLSLRRLWRGVRWATAALGIVFCVWLLLFAMPATACFGLGWAALIAPIPKGRWLSGLWQGRGSVGRGVAAVATVLGSVLFIWEVSLPEYGAEARRLGCIVRGAFHGHEPRLSVPAWCDGVEWVRRPASDTGALFSTRERLGISGFNILLSAGGTLAGLPEVAWETLALNFIDDPLPDIDAKPMRERWQRCKAGAGQGVEAQRRSSEFAMASPTIRKAAAVLAERAAGLAQGEVRDLGSTALDWRYRHGNNNVVYNDLASRDSLRVALALLVPGARLAGTARRDDQEIWLDLEWRVDARPARPSLAAFDSRTVAH